VKTIGGILVILGVLAMISQTDLVDINFFGVVWHFWPVLLVWLGLWIFSRDSPFFRILLVTALVLLFLFGSAFSPGLEISREDFPLEGTCEKGEATLSFGVGEMLLDADTPGVLSVDYPGTDGAIHSGFDRNTRRFSFEMVHHRSRNLPPGEWRYHVGLTREIPWEVRLDMGVMKATVDFSQAGLSHFEGDLGIGELNLVLGSPKGVVVSDVNLGIGELTLKVPADTRVLLEVTGAVKQVQILGDPLYTEEDNVYYLGPAESDSYHHIKAEVGIGQIVFISR